MKLLWIILHVSIAHLSAYEEVFQAKTVVEVRHLEVKQSERDRLEERCWLAKQGNGFRWPCFIVEGRQKWTPMLMNQHCTSKVDSIVNKASLPSKQYLASLTKDCQTLIKTRLRILAYKANGT